MLLNLTYTEYKLQLHCMAKGNLENVLILRFFKTT